MALDKNGLKSDIKTLLQDMLTREDNSMEEFATRLSEMIDVYVKTGTVTVSAGIIVTAGGYPGATTSTGTGTIN